jgi:hypothetical protein
MPRRREPLPRRLTVLRDALRRASSVGPVSLPITLGLASGIAASFAVDAVLIDQVRTPARQVVDAIAFMVVAGVVWIVTQPRRVRDAHDVLAWLNAWETERWSTEVGRRLPGLPRMSPRLLDDLPDTMGLAPLHIELLAVRGRVHEARSRLARLPADTPWQRFERAALDEWVGWWAGDPERLEPMRAAAAELADADERRLVAAATIAAAEARRNTDVGGDAVAPLAAVRPALGNRLGRYAFGYRTGVLVMVSLIGAVAAGSIVVAAAILR